jgi:hypothetical protein
MTNREEHLLAVLEIIAQNSGSFGWYQLDRTLSMHGNVGIHVGNVLQDLLDRSLIDANGNPSQANTRYYATPAGLAFLRANGRV